MLKKEIQETIPNKRCQTKHWGGNEETGIKKGITTWSVVMLISTIEYIIKYFHDIRNCQMDVRKK